MKAIVNTSICPLMLRPSHQCERADEALFGMTVTILDEPCPNWYHVETHYRYTGYVSGPNLFLGEGNATRWEILHKAVILKTVCDVLAAPDVQSWTMVTLARGSLVALVGIPNENGWQKISLPDGREGYTKRSFLGDYYKRPSFHDEPGLRRALTATAITYFGTQYRWGGKSPQGIDCSGLTAMAYLLNGVIIYRDAQIKEGFPLKEIPIEQRKPGDLLFFPGHVAMYLGEDKFIHATSRGGSDGVVVNSLNPLHPDYRKDLEEGLSAVGSIF